MRRLKIADSDLSQSTYRLSRITQDEGISEGKNRKPLSRSGLVRDPQLGASGWDIVWKSHSPFTLNSISSSAIAFYITQALNNVLLFTLQVVIQVFKEIKYHFILLFKRHNCEISYLLLAKSLGSK